MWLEKIFGRVTSARAAASEVIVASRTSMERRFIDWSPNANLYIAKDG
jgi:hypothetical protein